MSANTDTTRRGITASAAASAIGPYGHGVLHGNILYCSGALPLDPDTEALVAGSRAEETEQCLRNLAAVREAVGVAALPKDARVEIDAIVPVD